MVGAETPQQWRVIELTFAAQRDYDRPFDLMAVGFSAEFRGPDGQALAVPGFYDGGRTWRVRFTPTAPGQWTYRTTCADHTDAGLDGPAGALSVAPAEGPNRLYLHGGFLRVSTDRHYLTYADGTPCFWLGDTWWFCPSALVPFEGSSDPRHPSAFRTMIDTRAAQGYTVAQMCFLGPSELRAGAGPVQLLHPGTWQPAQAAYWQEVDRYVRYAIDAGIMPVVGMCFHTGADPVTLEDFEALWRYFIARYGAMGVTFLIQGEYNLKQGDWQARVEKVRALGRFIKETDPYKRAMTVHPWWYGGDDRQTWDDAWYDFILVQGGHGQDGPPADFYRAIYGRPDPKPLLEDECTYEGIHGFTDLTVRRNAYKGIQSGSFGYTYGSHGLWYPNQDAADQTFNDWGPPLPWWEALARPGGGQMKHLRECYESVEWWKLVPRKTQDVLQGADDKRALVKADGEGAFLVYFPGGGAPATVALKAGREGTAYGVTLFDPRMGEARALPAVTVRGGRAELPALPDEQDWVLILRRR